MKFFVDTEFVFSAASMTRQITPLSLAIVSETRDSLYLTMPRDDRPSFRVVPDFVRTAVYPALDHPEYVPIKLPVNEWGGVIRRWIDEIGEGEEPDFWGDCAAFDYVILSIVMGGFDKWPDGWPYYINDFAQSRTSLVPSKVPHNALADAVALLDSWEAA